MSCSVDVAEQFCFQNVFALLVFFSRLVRLVVLPSDRLLALSAADVSYDMSSSSHVALASLALVDVYDVVKEESLSMLATEVLQT